MESGTAAKRREEVPVITLHKGIMPFSNSHKFIKTIDQGYRVWDHIQVVDIHEDIYITKNGKTIAKLTNPNQNRVDTAKSLFGILPQDADIEEAREERLALK